MNDMYYRVKIKPYILDLKLRNLVRTFQQQMTTIDSNMNLKLNSMILKCHEIQSQLSLCVYRFQFGPNKIHAGTNSIKK